MATSFIIFAYEKVITASAFFKKLDPLLKKKKKVKQGFHWVLMSGVFLFGQPSLILLDEIC